MIKDRIHIMKAERNGKEVEFAHIDGGRGPARDSNNDTYIAIKDVLVFEDCTIVCEVDSELFDSVTNKLEFRWSEMIAHLEGIGINPDTVRPA